MICEKCGGEMEARKTTWFCPICGNVTGVGKTKIAPAPEARRDVGRYCVICGRLEFYGPENGYAREGFCAECVEVLREIVRERRQVHGI